jgi:hypothetical protein
MVFGPLVWKLKPEGDAFIEAQLFSSSVRTLRMDDSGTYFHCKPRHRTLRVVVAM